MDDVCATILRTAEDWSFPVSTEAAERISRYFQLLLEWNFRVNLTGARDSDELLGDHLPDSFALARLLPNSSDVVDVGSGGGLPAIPFAIVRPHSRTTLVEPRAKRVAFLNTVVRVCGCFNVRVIRTRLDEFRSPVFSAATSRATFSPEEWLELAPSLLVPGGRIVVLAAKQIQSPVAKLTLVDSVEYRTAHGSPRWAGCFCST